MLNHDILTSTITVRDLLRAISNAPDLNVEVSIITPDGIYSCADVVAAGNTIAIRGWDKKD